MPHGFFKLGSVFAASPGTLDVSLVWTNPIGSAEATPELNASTSSAMDDERQWNMGRHPFLEEQVVPATTAARGTRDDTHDSGPETAHRLPVRGARTS